MPPGQPAASHGLLNRQSGQRWLKKWKTDNAETFLALTNPDAWKNRHMAAFGSLTDGITRACQLWQLDSTPADLQLVVRHVRYRASASRDGQGGDGF
ncbi:hypothetical protein [Lysobacter sp. CA199]|uniref:hypothetical protein n=1 Tax=Lysobacter sp. CA199 TaxID=3455608 RepID=UPI003F8D0BCB